MEKIANSNYKKYYNLKNKKLCGYYSYSDKTYRKKVVREKHLMRMFNGYGIDRDIIIDLKRQGCDNIRIMEIDTGQIYEVPFEKFIKNGIEKDFEGIQIFIPAKFWTIENNKQQKLL
jgi:hypothetical protein